MTAGRFEEAVLVLAYGGPETLDEIPGFMCSLTGREPSDETCTRVRRRYLAIGGASPLPQIARSFAAGLEDVLAEEGLEIPVLAGFRYSSPSIADVMAQLYDLGVCRLVTVSLTPFESRITTEAYRAAVADAAATLEGLEVVETPLFSSMREYVDTHTGSLAVALNDLDTRSALNPLIVFTAHSLPLADLTGPDDPYVAGVRRVAQAIAGLIGLPPGDTIPDEANRLPGIEAFGSLEGERGWLVAYQSKGMRPGEWLGPELTDVIRVAAHSGYSAVVVSPVGFATEHMETLYDLDIEAAGHALDEGIEFARSETPNTAPTLMKAVAAAVRIALGHAD